MKLIVMVPCYNEEKTLPLVIKSIPKKISGIDVIETLIVDDGCEDKTVEVARKVGVNHIVRHKRNKGLAKSFADGLEACLSLGADIIVNTDGDNQYPQKDIPKLIKPILDGKADIVIADRQTRTIQEFSPVKKFLQWIGSWTVKMVSGADIPDAVSGFRAYSREAAIQMNIVSDFSYVVETIIQAGKKRIPMVSVKVKTNPKLRESRLFSSIFDHVKKSTSTIIRIYAMYEPLKTFFYIGGLIFLGGILVAIRFLYFFFIGTAGGHVQSLILAAVAMIIGFQIILIGLIADLIAANRKLLEDLIVRHKKEETDLQDK